MVQSRKEPTISSADLHSPLEEDTQSKRNTRAKKPAKPVTEPSPAAPVPSKGGSGLAVVSLIVALVAVAGCGYLFMQLQASNSELVSATDRIASLEKRLTLSDDESSQSVTALQANLKQAVKDVATNESEIRKLWDTRNVNRRAIAANKDELNSLEKQTKSSLDKLTKSLAGVEALQAKDGKQISALASQLKSLDQQMVQAKKQLIEADKLASQVKGISQLQVRVTSNEEAIEAIDAYRLNINRQLLDLQKHVNQTP